MFPIYDLSMNSTMVENGFEYISETKINHNEHKPYFDARSQNMEVLSVVE